MNKKSKIENSQTYRLIGIILVILILGGVGGIIYKTQNFQPKAGPPLEENIQIQNNNQNTNLQPLSSKININTADQQSLETLPGIGPVKAQAIIDYRQKSGNFKAKKDIIKVKGIGEKTYEKIEDKIEI